MASFNQPNIFYTDQAILGADQVAQNEGNNAQDLENAELKFMHFIQETQERNVYIYR